MATIKGETTQKQKDDFQISIIRHNSKHQPNKKVTETGLIQLLADACIEDLERTLVCLKNLTK